MNNRNFKKHFGMILVFSFYVLANNISFAQVSKGGVPPSFSLKELKKNSGTWETLSNGDKIWRLKIYS